VAQPQLQSGLGRIAWAGRPMRSRHWRCPGVLHSGVASQAFYLPAQPGSPMCAYTTCLGRYIKVASSVISMYAVSLCYAPHHTLLRSQDVCIRVMHLLLGVVPVTPGYRVRLGSVC
jgi:hypothetical protein